MVTKVFEAMVTQPDGEPINVCGKPFPKMEQRQFDISSENKQELLNLEKAGYIREIKVEKKKK
jgi:hypothetical protein